MSVNWAVDRINRSVWYQGLATLPSKLLSFRKNLQSLLSLHKNVSWKFTGNHTCWYVRHPVLPGFLLSFLSSANLWARQMELSRIWPHGRGSKCNLKMHVRNLGYPIPLQTGDPKTTFFGRLRNSTATLTAYIFGTKDDSDNQASALQTTRGLLHRLKTTWNLVHKRLQIGSEFSHTLRKICIPLHCHASQKEISERNSTTLCQTVDGRSR